MFLNQLSIAKRLACVLGLILSLSLLTSLFAVFKLRQMGEVTDAMLAVNLKTERAAADWLRNTTAGVQRAAANRAEERRAGKEGRSRRPP